MAELPPLPAARRRPVPLVLDTDMNEDVDDAGALAVMHALADLGLAEVLALTYCTSAVWGVPAVQAINRWYGRPELAVGSFGRAGFIDEHADLSYIRFLAEAYQPAGRGTDDAPEALALLRRTLAARAAPDVVLVGIGPLPNLAALLDSGPDDASPLSGDELIRRSVRKLVLMAGRIPEGIEYNLRQDPGSARRVLSDWPTPVVICDGELGGPSKRELGSAASRRAGIPCARRMLSMRWAWTGPATTRRRCWRRSRARAISGIPPRAG